MSFDIHMYEPPLSLWGIIQEYIADSEHYEVKSCLGEDLIDQSKELREEINTLLEIYQDFRELESSRVESSFSILPEPPDLRNRVKQEIVFFLEGIREQAKIQGRDVNKILQKHNSDVIDYAYESGSSRPSTSDSSLTTSRSCSLRVTPLSGRSGATTARSIDVGAMQDKLNYLQFDDVCKSLRAHLQEEVGQLRLDLEEIQNSLCAEETERTISRTSREPSLTELKEERHRLEQTLLDSSRPLPNFPDTRKMSHPRPSKPIAPGPVKVIHSFVPCPPAPTSPVHNHRNSPTSPDSKNQPTKIRRTPSPFASPVRPGTSSSPLPQLSPASTPPCSARPTSAQRFRNMVLDCRQDLEKT